MRAGRNACQTEEVAVSISRVLSQRAWGDSINCFLVRDGDATILIDCPNYNAKTGALIRALEVKPTIYLTHAAASGDAEKWRVNEGLEVALNALDSDDKWLSCTPTKLFEGDVQITPSLTAYHMPDHSAGHTMYHDTRNGGTLFAGDAILCKDGKFQIELSSASRHRLLALRFKRILPLHYGLVLSDGYEAIAHAL